MAFLFVFFFQRMANPAWPESDLTDAMDLPYFPKGLNGEADQTFSLKANKSDDCNR